MEDVAEHAPHQCDQGLSKAFEVLGKRWNGVILGTLQSGPASFSDLRRGIGSITDSVLSDRLNELSGLGLVDRTVADTRPPSVLYELTASGQAVIPALEQLGAWAAEHLPGAAACTEEVPSAARKRTPSKA